MTTGLVCNRYKEQIRMAMKFSKIEVSEDENGPIYETVPKDEAVAEVMRIIDEMYFQFSRSVASGRAMETLLNKYVPDLDKKQYMRDFMQENEKELLKEDDYEYEPDEFYEEIERRIKKNQFTVIDGGKKD